MVMMHKNRSVDPHRFAMTPKADIPRAVFDRQWTHKTTFDAGYLVPCYVDEVLPGDSFNLRMTAFSRMATPLFPIMDNLRLSTFFFFVPNRLLWSNWQKFMGEQINPGDSISYVVPQVVSAAGGFPINSIFDQMGLPTVGQVLGGNTVSVNALPVRAYNQIYNEWFRDENLCLAQPKNIGDGPDPVGDYVLVRRGKRHDYFTSCLPWPQKGSTAVTLPLGTSAPVFGTGKALGFHDATTAYGSAVNAGSGFTVAATNYGSNQGVASGGAGAASKVVGVVTAAQAGATPSNSGLYADLSTATAATINQLRQSFQIQKLLERDARGGTRYTEIIRSHFGVISPDARLQRPEYLGGGVSPVLINPIAQTSGTGLTGGTTPLGNLSGVGTLMARHGFSQAFTEHGYVIGIMCIDADLTYQQGIRKLWSRSTRYDFYFPVFSHLGEQAVLNREIYADGSVNDANVFGYQERWAEYRYMPSVIAGLFKSRSAGTIDPWHLAQNFTSLPTLNATFINSTPPISRVVAAGLLPITSSFFLIRSGSARLPGRCLFTLCLVLLTISDMFGIDDALFAVGGSLLGGMLNNEAADDRQQDANTFSAQQFASRYQTTVKDMAAAGLNPGLAYGGISGNAPTGAIASPGGFPDLGASYNQGRQASNAATVAQSQAKLMDAQTANQAAQGRLYEAQATKELASANQADANTTLIGQNVQKIKAEIPLLQSNTRNADEQRYVINRTVDMLVEQAKLMAQQGQTQSQIRAQLQAQVQKLGAETKLIGFDVDAAEKFGNVGRDMGQWRWIVDLVKALK